MDETGGAQADVALQTRSGVDRRTLIKRAAAAGAIAWTAPIIVDSIASPAAAVTCGTAITVTSILNPPFTNTTAGSNSYTTGSMTTASTSGHTVLLLVVTDQATATETLSASGGPVTGSWTEITHVTFDTKVDKGVQKEAWTLWAFRGTANGTSGAITITPTSKSGQEIVASVLQLDNEKTATPIASNPTNSAASGNATVTFGAPASACDAQIMFVGNIYDNKKGTQSNSWTPATNFTELTDQSTGTAGTISEETAARTSGIVSGTNTATPSLSAAAWGSIGLEINVP